MTIPEKSPTRYSGLFSLLFYGLGAVLWHMALASSHYKRLFDFAVFSFVAAFLCSIKWLWRHEFFRRSSSGHRRSRSGRRRRYSDENSNPHSDLQSHEYTKTHVERRHRKPRTNRKRRSVAVSFAVFIFLCAITPLGFSYRTHIAESEIAPVDIFLVNAVSTDRTKAKRTPFSESSDHPEEMAFALADVPTHNVRVLGGEKSITVKVVLRNPNRVYVGNTHIKIYSDLPIRDISGQLTYLSATKIGGDILGLPPYQHAEDEQTFFIEIMVPEYRTQAKLLISVAGDNLPLSAGVSNISWVKKT